MEYIQKKKIKDFTDLIVWQEAHKEDKDFELIYGQLSSARRLLVAFIKSTNDL